MTKLRKHDKSNFLYENSLIAKLFQVPKFNIVDYQYINEVPIVFFPCLFDKSKKIHKQFPASRSLYKNEHNF